MLRRVRRDERGVSIAELLIAMAIFSLIGGVALGGLGSSSRSLGQVDDEVQGLQDLRTVTERVSRDLRQARGIVATYPTGAVLEGVDVGGQVASDATKVTIWIDANSDYKESAAERVTWTLRAGANPGQYDVVRLDNAGGKSVVGHSLVSNIAFSYDSPPPKTRVVTVDMTYDAMPFRYATSRHTMFETRLRNVQ